MLLHLGVFQLDVDSQQRSVWHSLVPQVRLLCAVLFVFATALTPNGRWWTWGLYAAGLLGLICCSRITLPVLLKRVAVESTFIGVVLLGALFQTSGTILWRWGMVQITTGGLLVLGSVTTKALLSLIMMNLLVLTTSVPALLKAMVALRVPPLLVAIFASMYRYIGLLSEEFTMMRRAAASRNLTQSARRQRLVLGNMIGSLFLRTYDRGERIHQAMLSRGYGGLPPVAGLPQLCRRDFWAISLLTFWLLLGQLFYLH